MHVYDLYAEPTRAHIFASSEMDDIQLQGVKRHKLRRMKQGNARSMLHCLAVRIRFLQQHEENLHSWWCGIYRASYWTARSHAAWTRREIPVSHRIKPLAGPILIGLDEREGLPPPLLGQPSWESTADI
ncbi:hypothetical protein SKAU_G00034320 [Synaphobranchus kaupii]|uniref:Uncharacterized protein n=1 Tax=Synaphobranchus kaupii TaxID=118154 RepID=A0A9Q1GEG1_SYNKA|nr:hypothetical protein SKAU_G00034320 [Synaphobranchus kaupii]